VSRCVRRLVALALLAGGGSALAFVRETTTPRHPETGVCLWWGKRQVSFQVNATTTMAAPCQDPVAAQALTVASIRTWNGATRSGDTAPCTDFTFVDGGPTTKIAIDAKDGVNLVVFRQGLCDDPAFVPANEPCHSKGACSGIYNCWEHDLATIALTTTSYDTTTGEILDADVELNGWSGSTTTPTGSFLTCGGATVCGSPPYSGPPGCRWIDVGEVTTHEAGHMLGLDHTCQYPAPYDSCSAGITTMDPDINGGETAKRVLSQDDVAGVCTIYPAGGPTATCVKPGAKSHGGCAAAGTSGGVPALLALGVALWRRRRARVAPTRG